MILLDVNVLLYAHKRQAANHDRFRGWLEEVASADEPFGLHDGVLASFVRIATHPRIFDRPSSPFEALQFVAALRSSANCVGVSPGDRHWEIFETLVRTASARGNLVADAFLAALAIESGCEWITTDRDFARFPGLRWRTPF